MSEDLIYARFEKTKQDGSTVKLRIQDMQECDKDRVIEFMEKWFYSEENMLRASGIAQSEDAIKELRGLIYWIFQEKTAYPLVCYAENENAEEMDIVGCNVLILETKELKFPEVRSKNVLILKSLVDVMEKQIDLASKLNVDTYISGAGLAVDPSYRGCGIATELLKARKPMMSARGVPMTSAWFTSTASQKAAKKAGYEEVADLTFEELTRRTGVVFTDVPKSVKLMVLRA